MAKVLRTSLAEQDLYDIWSYIARDNLDAADKLLARIDQAFATLLRHPQLGEKMDRFRLGLRAWPVDILPRPFSRLSQAQPDLLD